jgi:hypothetical protein
MQGVSSNLPRDDASMMGDKKEKMGHVPTHSRSESSVTSVFMLCSLWLRTSTLSASICTLLSFFFSCAPFLIVDQRATTDSPDSGLPLVRLKFSRFQNLHYFADYDLSQSPNHATASPIACYPTYDTSAIPLSPIYHVCVAHWHSRTGLLPLCVVNLGGLCDVDVCRCQNLLRGSSLRRLNEHRTLKNGPTIIIIHYFVDGRLVCSNYGSCGPPSGSAAV